MAETENISKMAEKISTEIFEILGWEKVGPLNQNWTCQNPKHEKNTHPTDIVFKYKEPYSSKTTYLNVDLKSYSTNTISTFDIQKCLQSLALAVDCANISSEWKDMYQSPSDNTVINGLLFIYNHDGEYDKNFNTKLDCVDSSKLMIPKGNKLFVLGPKDICFLSSVVTDIQILRGTQKIPFERLSFYYPDLISKRVNSSDSLAATIEMILSPYISFKYSIDNKKVMRLYYKETGENIEEFLYLFDYLFHYQQFQECEEIYISLFIPSKNAAAVFDRAKKQYANDKENEKGISAVLEKVKYNQINKIKTSFSEVEIGME